MTENPGFKREYSAEELHAAWTTAIECFGERTVAFLLDLEAGVLPGLADGRRWSGVVLLGRQAKDVPMDHPVEVQISYKVHTLTQKWHGAPTLAEAIRVYSGGHVSHAVDGDAVLQQLNRLAFAALAAEFIPGLDHDRFSLSAAFQDPSVVVPLCQVFLADKRLKKLFPDALHPVDVGNYNDINAIHYWSLGGGGTAWLTIMLGNIIEQTLARMRLERDLKEESLVAYLAQSLDSIRRAADGQEIEVPVIAGLKGAAPVRDFRSEHGGILPAQGLALELMPHDIPPHSVAYINTKTRLMAVLPKDPGDDNQLRREFLKYTPEWQRAFQQVRRDFDLVRFWIVVWAHENERTAIKPTLTGWWVMNPSFKTNPAVDVGARGGASQQPLDMHGGAAEGQVLDDSNLDGIAEIAGKFKSVPKPLSLGVTRIVRALVERDDPMDSFVDAVIAWENLVGAATETTFRVCAALATLLEPDNAERRVEMLKSLKTAYGKRSRLVHGGEEPKLEELGQLRDQAIGVAIRAMQLVLENNRLADLKNSSDRSDAILVGEWRPLSSKTPEAADAIAPEVH